VVVSVLVLLLVQGNLEPGVLGCNDYYIAVYY
jgi:hypothetical protein